MSKKKKNKNVAKQQVEVVKTEVVEVPKHINTKKIDGIVLSKLQLASVVLTSVAVTLVLGVAMFVALPVSTTASLYDLKPVITAGGQEYTMGDFIRDNKGTLNGEEFRNQQVIALLVDNEVKSVSVTDAEIKTEYDNFIKAYGGDEATVLDTISKSGFTKDDLMKQLTKNVKITKILFDRVQVTDEQIKEYYATKIIGQTDPKKFEDLTADEKATYTKELKSTKANDEYNTWTQDLLKKANEDKTTQYFDVK